MWKWIMVKLGCCLLLFLFKFVYILYHWLDFSNYGKLIESIAVRREWTKCVYKYFFRFMINQKPIAKTSNSGLVASTSQLNEFFFDDLAAYRTVEFLSLIKEYIVAHVMLCFRFLISSFFFLSRSLFLSKWWITPLSSNK